MSNDVQRNGVPSQWARDVFFTLSLLGAVVSVHFIESPQLTSDVAQQLTPSVESPLSIPLDPAQAFETQSEMILTGDDAEAPPVIGEFDEFPVAKLPVESVQADAGSSELPVATTVKPRDLATISAPRGSDHGPSNGGEAASSTSIEVERPVVASNQSHPPRSTPGIASGAPKAVRNLAPLNHLDQVVDRFIAYDIGQLSGLAGSQARDDFNRLGPEALDALVRGLNRSASISASCPVIVLESKLRTCLTQSGDPDAVELAMQHIGDGVPANAPHYTRLVGYRNQLINQLPAGHPIRLRVERSQRLIQARDDSQIDAALKSSDPEERQAAAFAARAMGVRFGKQLIHMLRDPVVEVRQEAHQGLIRIARDVDFGPNEPATSEAVVKAVVQWERWWNEQIRHNVPNSIWRASPTALKGMLKHQDDRVRFAVVMVIHSKGLRLIDELIGLLRDPDPFVRREAHLALLDLAKGENFGPSDWSNADEVTTAIIAWNHWRDRQKLLFRYGSLTNPQVIEEFKNANSNERWAAVAAARRRRLRVGDELIGLLIDTNHDVRQEARHALIHLADGSDFGPSETANEEERRDAITQWTKWWKEQSKTKIPPIKSEDRDGAP